MADFDESKKVSTEDMEQVAGGGKSETADDSRFLNVLLKGRPEQPDRYGEYKCSGGSHDEEIFRAWASVGVHVKFDSGSVFTEGGFNQYSINGNVVSQGAARQHAMKVVGKHLKRSDWDWE